MESDYEVDYDKGLFMHFDVEDVDWVLEEQGARDGIPYRPVSEKEARAEMVSSLNSFSKR